MNPIDAQIKRIVTVVIPAIEADESLYASTKMNIIHWLRDTLEDARSCEHEELSTKVKTDLPAYAEKFGTVDRQSWLDALESEQNTQVRGSLFESFQEREQLKSIEYCASLSTCCLGVAPKLAGLPFCIESTHMRPEKFFVDSQPETNEAAALIKGLLRWESSFAMFLNDTAHLDFNQIAWLFRLIWDMPRPAEDTPA